MANFGILLIDKPADITSFNVISQLRKITDIKRIGHTGTLDPFATGLLPICLGPATRLASYISSARKTYLATIKFGFRTDTGDVTGKTISTQPVKEISPVDLQKAISSVLQLKEQTPPAYSAIKVNGERAYSLARQGKEVKLTPRPITIYDFQIINIEADSLTYQATVSKGTYIRSLTEHFAELTCNMATTTALKRLAVDKLELSQAVKLSDLTPDNWQKHLLSPASVLTLPQILLSDQETIKFMNGSYIEMSFSSEKEFLVIQRSKLRALGIARLLPGNLLKPAIVLPQ
ncbi:MAG: tRNA pseudouridine(55) synthase TruB [Candidatus Cloacimonetes bacterium]|nr:tRNA pseudouridine(55) synthase TruB [Candidatus Cloacimonadota bacterium]